MHFLSRSPTKSVLIHRFLRSVSEIVETLFFAPFKQDFNLLWRNCNVGLVQQIKCTFGNSHLLNEKEVHTFRGGAESRIRGWVSAVWYTIKDKTQDIHGRRNVNQLQQVNCKLRHVAVLSMYYGRRFCYNRINLLFIVSYRWRR